MILRGTERRGYGVGENERETGAPTKQRNKESED